MSLSDLVPRYADKIPADAQIVSAAAVLGMGTAEFFDAFAREVAAGYLSGVYAWPVADRAMTHLFAAAYSPSDFGLPQFAWDVYIAFDEGEYTHKDSPELDGEPRTRAILATIVGGSDA